MKITLISTSTFPADQGLRTLSACLKREGHEVKLIFLPLSEDYDELYSPDVLAQVEKTAENSGLIGVSAMGSTQKRAEQLISLFESKDIPVVWGGPHTTFFPQKCIESCKIVCVGEAEDTFIELADKLEHGEDISNVKNLWIKKENNEIIANDVRPPIEDLDLLAHPDFDIEEQLILDNGKLRQFQEKDIGGIIYFQTERGCPQACSYCTNNILRKIYKGKSDLLRTHSVDYVIEEFVRLKKKFPSIGAFDIRDETFLIRPIAWIKEFAEKYKEKVGIRFKCLSEPASMNAEELTDEKLKLLVDAGLTDIIIGIQSGSDRLNFQLYNRFISAKQVLKAAHVAHKYTDRMTIMYDIISSNPYETKEDILETIKLLLEVPAPFFLSVNNLVFFEGTPLYEKALKDGYVKENDHTSEINYWDRWKHIKRKNKNAYLDLVLNMMRGPATKKRFGLLPRKLVERLINDKLVNFNYEHLAPTYIVGNLVQALDFTRENIAKPVYRSMPVSFKMWYDKVRYKA